LAFFEIKSLDFQCSGEAKYVGDTPLLPREVHGAFVLAKVGNCDMDGDANPSAALALPGVIAFIDYRDIPGQNKASTGSHLEEIFSAGKLHYAGQAVGLVVAETRELALKAARLVEVKYRNRQR
jgi:xanthine dehydrogenase/oxidase